MPIAQSNGIDLYYEEEGSGEPLVLIMGLSAQHEWWSRQLIDGFIAQGFRIIRFDNRDVGQSTRLDALGTPNVRLMTAGRLLGGRLKAPYTLEDLADDTLGLMDHLGIERAHVMGGSMGGMVAQRVTLKAPTRVASLTLLYTNTGSRLDGIAAPSVIRTLLKPPPQGREATIDRLAEVGQLLTGPHYPYDEAYWRDLAVRCWNHSSEPPGTPRQLAAVLASPSTRERLREIEQPTLVIHGTADPLLPLRGGIRLAHSIRRARLLMLEGMGHYVPPSLRDTVVLNVRAVANSAPLR